MSKPALPPDEAEGTASLSDSAFLTRPAEDILTSHP